MKEIEKKTQSIYDMDHDAPRGSWVSEFMWLCSGADRRILRHCPPDHSKYVGIGGTILFTALMACLSGGYAFYTVFDNEVTAIAFGIFWGLLIFNLDRFMVNTMYSDGLASISKEEIMSGAPRIIMAIFLGIVISTPLELKIYHNEIMIEIEKMKQDKAREYTMEALARIAANDDKIANLKAEEDNILTQPMNNGSTIIISNNDRLNELNAKRNSLYALWTQKNISYTNKANQSTSLKEEIKELKEQIKKTRNATEIETLEKQLKTKESQSAQVESQCQKLSLEKQTLSNEIAKIDAERIKISGESKDIANDDYERRKAQMAAIDKEITAILAQNDSLHRQTMEEEHRYKDKLEKEFGGFQAQLSAFGHLKNENTTTQMASWFIMLLFIIIETVPTFFKMMMTDGPYDDLMRAERHIAKVLADKRINDINDEINTQIDISMSRNLKSVEAEQRVNEMTVEKMAQAQAYVIQEAIDQWKLLELKKVREDPGAYLQTNSPVDDGEQAKA